LSAAQQAAAAAVKGSIARISCDYGFVPVHLRCQSYARATVCTPCRTRGIGSARADGPDWCHAPRL
jgi:hypothetical protein